MATRAVLSGRHGLVLLHPAILATPPYVAVLADAQAKALLAVASLAVVLADARPAALLAAASFAVVLADARPAALLALASLAVVLADARPAALLASASYAAVDCQCFWRKWSAGPERVAEVRWRRRRAGGRRGER